MISLVNRGIALLISITLLLSCSNVVHAQAPQARIKIDTDRTIGEVDPMLFGNFTEHLGRMIYGGIYEEESPLSDANGYRKDVLEVVRQLNVSILRWPGGNFASGYNWKDGIGSKDQRPTRIDLAWNDLESNRFGTDEFLKYCEILGTEPYICINAGRTDGSNRTNLNTGLLAMRSMAHGNSAIKTPKNIRSGRSKQPRRCDLWTATSNSSLADQVIMGPIGSRGIAPYCKRYATRRITSRFTLTSTTATTIWKGF